MLLIPTYIAKSPIHGMGVYTSIAIPTQTLIWSFESHVDLFMNPVPDLLKHRVYKVPRGWILCTDNAAFMNHSTTPNVVSRNCNRDYTARAIAAHEELTIDYSTFDLDWQSKGVA